MWLPGNVLILLLYLTAGAPVNAACVDVTEGVASMHVETIRLVNDAGSEISIDVLVADDGFERASGFQHICPDVIDETFILFRYPQEVDGRFHMQNVHAPLDIAFFAGSGDVVSVLRMDTYSEHWRPIYGPDAPFQFALEARPGFFSGQGISPDASYLVLE